jgi:hypothetical protein
MLFAQESSNPLARVDETSSNVDQTRDVATHLQASLMVANTDAKNKAAP